ncbi:MarR family winged helix-turn-helix transcriptional regulator [Actinomadura madurae]|uniref:MarR family winged helix-turn-helix transcriptional regulator n=1 Tax=Actinomadura madurae TaxID=1993 RepID=UPI0020D1F8FC|nr:MarR family transcriptional regulator [Actinomadura madurae]MCP9955163.1 MarR family transcriptional regulator [Actinomadura madurae]MCP9971897.1 MarR family transcriptional regulator [Actinomadura madurae]MCP9984402.1 MarR family transcriptional regulator [Actinomadura madurae]MCQ0004047.1 MarR family transcriptional regulator [Actinomadura madurae]MCQ0020593.1 MarR family transcriptional regulator [Actinomadura madurae]
MDDAGAPLEPRELRAWMAFLAAGHLIEHEVERQLKRAGGLSHPEFEVLLRLSAAEGERMRMSDLAREVMVSKSRLTYQVTQLERAGLVKRTACESDRRSVWAELTDAGTAALAAVRPGHREVVREVLIEVLTPEEIDLLGDALSRVAGRLRER